MARSVPPRNAAMRQASPRRSSPPPSTDLTRGTRRVKVTDSNGLSTIATATVFILNVAPTLHLAGAADAASGVAYPLGLSVSDPGSDTITKWVITWGDGVVQTVNGNPSSVSKVFANPGSYTITATATDEDGTYSAGNSVHVTVVTDTVRPTAAWAPRRTSSLAAGRPTASP